MRPFHTITVVLAACLSLPSSGVGAVEKCKTTLDCAQQAVEAAAQANAAVAVLQGRIEKLETQLNTLVQNGPQTVFDRLEFVVRQSQPSGAPSIECQAKEKLVAASCMGQDLVNGQAA